MKTEDCIKQILQNIGEDPNREGLIETPKRVSNAYKEFFAGYGQDPAAMLKTFENEGYDEMILVRNIEYFSHCEHHMVPFMGVAHVAYIPDKRITGLSKLPRLVEIFSKRLQNQERITVQVGETLQKELSPKGVAVFMTGRHLCMSSRGVKNPASETITTYYTGQFKENMNARTEFLQQIKA